MTKRGRPARDDDAVLRTAAMKLAKGEVATPRSAISQALPPNTSMVTHESNLRRVQRKWGQIGEKLLADAQVTLDRQKKDQDQAAQRRRIEEAVASLAPSSPGYSSLGPLHDYSNYRALLSDMDAMRNRALEAHTALEEVKTRAKLFEDYKVRDVMKEAMLALRENEEAMRQLQGSAGQVKELAEWFRRK